MKTRNAPSVSSSRRLGHVNRTSRTYPVGLFVRAGAFLVFFGLLATSLYSGSSASLSRKVKDTGSSVAPTAQASLQMAKRISPSLRESSNPFLLPAPQPSLPGIATYAADCTTPQSDFNLGDVVCAKATGVPVTIFSWHVSWVDPIG